jgi:hypothetical protein
MFRIDEDGNAGVDFHFTYFGKAAEAIRYIYKYMPPEQRKKSFEKRGIEVLDLEIGNFAETENPFFIRLRGKLKNIAQVIDPDTMILSNVIHLDAYRDITAVRDRLYPIILHASFHSQETFRYLFPDGFSVKRIPHNFISDQPHTLRKETFTMKGSALEVYVENSSRERKITRHDLDAFKKYALELQKHETAVKNIILERK